MRRLHAPIATLAAALVLGGCTTTQTTSTDDFKGDEKPVAQVVADLASAGKSKDAEKICSDILSSDLVGQLKSSGGDCVDEMDKAIADADDFDLEVTDVTVTGDTATAKVRQGTDGPTTTFAFTKQRSDWRVTSLSAG